MKQLKNKLFLSLVMLKFFDMLTTYLCFQNGGQELNPIVDYLITNLGIVSGLIIVFILFTIFIYFLRNKLFLQILIVIHIFVVFNNLYVLWGLW